jgi:hypothetical protein
MGANGFPGKRVDPMRAGITATIFMIYPLMSIARAGAQSSPANVSGRQKKLIGPRPTTLLIILDSTCGHIDNTPLSIF